MTDRPLKQGWKIWRFDQMATNVNVRIDNPSDSGMVHYVGLEHLDTDSLKIRRWGTPGDVEATKLLFKKGDIIFGRRRAYQRKLGVAEFDGICSAHAMVLRAKPDVVLPDFLPFFMQSDLFMNRAVEISVGSLSPTINWKTMAVQEFALPPMEEQRRAIEILAAATGVVESLRNLKITNDKVRLAFLNECFPENIAKRGPTTADMEIRQLSDVAEIRTGLALGKKVDTLETVERPYLRVANVQDGILALDEIKTLSVRSSELGRYSLRRGDVLMTEGGDFDKLGRGAVWQEEVEGCLHQNHVFAVRPDPELIRSEYIAAIARSPHGRRYFRMCAKRTSNLASINKKQLSAFPVFFLPLDIQDQIITIIQGCDESEKSATTRLSVALKIRSQLTNDFLGGVL